MENHLRFFGATASSFLAEGLYRTSIPIIAITLNDAPSAVGISIAVSKSPWLLASIAIGATIDRFTPLPLIRAGLLIRFVALSCLATLTFLETLTFFEFLAFSSIITIGDIAIEMSAQASIPRIFRSEHVAIANARLHGTQMIFAQLLAPSLAGFILSNSTKILIIFIISINLISIILSSSPITSRNQSPHQTSLIAKSFLAELRDPTLLALFFIGTIMMFSYGLWSSAFALYALDNVNGLGIEKYEYGFMMSSIALGALMGTISSEKLLKNATEHSLICFSSFAIFLLPVACIISRSSITVFLFLLIYGVSLSTWNMVAVSYRQRRVSVHVLGRITGIYRTISWGAMPAGAFLGAIAAPEHSPRMIFAVAAFTSTLQIFALPLLFNIRRKIP
ncbi:MFS transporter [Pandoraea sp. ISTKB]|uniref:MFS transporter n=1 Tax=Pandoraea sp. ISTKB TaxID=1586708 RepID=UPI0009F5EA3F|nr:MFS transporter [Pandoraea sp. ISTKB]